MSDLAKADNSPAVHASPSEKTASPYAWVVLLVVFLLSMAAPLNQFKVPPVLPLLIESFELSLGGGGLLMSVFAITGFFLALPAGYVLQRLGLKTSGLVSAACLLIGSLLGTYSNANSTLLLSRLVEGLGMGLISVTAPAAIAAWFPPHRRGTPMAIWAAWVPAGSLVMYILAPPLADRGGWQAVWWFGTVFTAVAFLIYALFMRRPHERQDPNPDEPVSENVSIGLALRNPQIWLLGAVFGCFTYTMLAVGTFYPTFLVEQRGYTVANAAAVLSLNNLAILLAAPAFGWLSDRAGARKPFFTFPFLALFLIVPLSFQIFDPLILPAVVVMGCITSAIPAVIFSATPEVVKNPLFVGMGMAVLTMGQNLGVVVGPALFGLLAEQVSWTAASLSLLPIFLLGFILAWRVRVR